MLLKNIITTFITITICQIGYAQVDSLSKTTFEMDNMLSPNLGYKTIDVKEFYFNNIKNVSIEKHGKRYVKMIYSHGDHILSEYAVEIILYAHCDVLLYAKRDSTPAVVCKSQFDVQENGKFKEWYDNKKIKIVGFYNHGKKSKKWRYYDESGKLIFTKRWAIE